MKLLLLLLCFTLFSCGSMENKTVKMEKLPTGKIIEMRTVEGSYFIFMQTETDIRKFMVDLNLYRYLRIGDSIYNKTTIIQDSLYVEKDILVEEDILVVNEVKDYSQKTNIIKK